MIFAASGSPWSWIHEIPGVSDDTLLPAILAFKVQVKPMYFSRPGCPVSSSCPAHCGRALVWNVQRLETALSAISQMTASLSVMGQRFSLAVFKV